MTSATIITVPKLTPNQRALLSNPARIVWIGAATKTGKSVGLALWILEGLLKGERCAWIGPWFRRTRSAFDLIRAFLEVPIRRGDVAVVEGAMKITGPAGGRVDFYSGDNPEAIYGEGYSRVVLDESSRQSETSLTAALTTISATGGKVRLAFNLERGSKNWAIRHLLRVKHMTPEERERSGEDYMTFPTATEGFVDPALIEQMRGKMPEALWRALYLAEIPTEDTALFRNLDAVFCAVEHSAPLKNHGYVMGIDLARKRDWTVCLVLDSATGALVAGDRFHEVSWTIQYERAAGLYQRFGCHRAIVDATGLGDPATEELRKLGMNVEGFIFTARSRKELVESLVVACDNAKITAPAAWAWLREELEAMEYELSETGDVRYAVPSGMTDDGLFAAALAWQGFTGDSGGFGFRRGPPIHSWSGSGASRDSFWNCEEADREDDERAADRGPLAGLSDF